MSSSHGVTRPTGEGPNEDFLLADDARGLYIAADGLGSYPGGHIASQLATETLAAELLKGPTPAAPDRKRWLAKASKAVAVALHARGKKEKGLKKMSACLTGLVLPQDGRYAVVHVGDTRAYLWRANELSQLTNDHSVAFEQYLHGAITKDQLRTHANQRLLTRSLTARQAFVITDILEGEVQPGDRFLLCSDGLSKAMNDEPIAAALQAGGSPQEVCDRLDQAAGDAGDDLTILVVQV